MSNASACSEPQEFQEPILVTLRDYLVTSVKNYALVVCNYSSVANLNALCAAIPHTKEYCAISRESFTMTDATIKSDELYRHVNLNFTSLILQNYVQS
jgi:hypothetical protein